MLTGAACGEAMMAAASTNETRADGIKRRDMRRARSALWISLMVSPVDCLENGSFPGSNRGKRLDGGISQNAHILWMPARLELALLDPQGARETRDRRPVPL